MALLALEPMVAMVAMAGRLGCSLLLAAALDAGVA
jgi:hypothetical protein